MKHIVEFLRKLARNTLGQDQVEYAIFLGVIVIITALSIPAVSDGIRTVFVNTQIVLEQAADNEKDKGNCRNPNPGNHGGRSPCAPSN